ncbi:hypothetical protein [Marinimicrobium sp. ABcell2]|uniref:c-type cytochrome n=1 Tax=Marinimicrobium sp. ABcell2 TaxID=3069751 RepID=UPI0027B29549|nr:hypothetical protein [Marinimicrobium sp. ABcell2]MDQ2078042.1 hypothetical protein [Marinimicrobium sp. ABcell2]
MGTSLTQVSCFDWCEVKSVEARNLKSVRSLARSAVLLGAMFSSGALAGMIDKEGMEAWETCALCHNFDGISPMPKFPKLAAQKHDYLKKQFMDFHTQSRTNDGGQMVAITTEIKLSDVDDAVAYFARLPPPEPAPLAESERSLYEAGRRLFQEGVEGGKPCAECHARADSPAPWLFTQHRDYLVKQLRDFQSGDRTNDGGVMRSIVGALSEGDIKTVATYLGSTPLEVEKSAKSY